MPSVKDSAFRDRTNARVGRRGSGEQCRERAAGFSRPQVFPDNNLEGIVLFWNKGTGRAAGNLCIPFGEVSAFILAGEKLSKQPKSL